MIVFPEAPNPQESGNQLDLDRTTNSADASASPRARAMPLADFLGVIWPSQGFYCVAQRKRKGDHEWWQHASYKTQEQAIEKLLAVGQLSDVWYTVLSLREPFLIDQSKIDKARAEGREVYEKTGRTYRTHPNMAWARTFFIDLDVGKAEGYATQRVAVQALKNFVKRTGLPRPWIVVSGVGLHVYWPFTADVPAHEWRVYATKLKALCQHNELKADPARTSDPSSVLRPPGTYHHKNPDDPKRVYVDRDGPISEWEDICAAIDRAHQLTPTGRMHDGDQPVGVAAAPVTMEQLRKACALADGMIAAPESVSEPGWYKLLGLVKFTDEGAAAAHEVSTGHPDYTVEETDKKLEQLNRRMPDGTTLGPTTCRNMAETCGSEHCHVCPFARTAFYKEGSSSPIVAARRISFETMEGVVPRRLLTAEELKGLPTEPYRVRGLLPARGLAAIYGCSTIFRFSTRRAWSALPQKLPPRSVRDPSCSSTPSTSRHPAQTRTTQRI